MISAPVLLASDANLDNELTVWDSLKRAIAVSPAFQNWQEEQWHEPLESPNLKPQQGDLETTPLLDSQVRRYLRQTLETLAY